MIRINLAAPEKAAKAKAKGSPARPIPSGALQSYLLLALFAGGALVLCAGAWWLQSNKLKDLETRIAADEKRQKDLQAIKQQVDQFQQRKAILENKVLVIEQLRLAQKSPVHMLDEISKALPDYVWLTGMTRRGAPSGSRARATAWPRSPTSSGASSAAAGSPRWTSAPRRSSGAS